MDDYKDKLANFDKLSTEEQYELTLEVERSECMYNLHYLAKNILGYDALGEIHKPLCDIVQSVNPLFMYMTKTSPWKTMDEVRDEIKRQLDAVKIPDEYKQYFEFGSSPYRRMFLMFRSGFKSTLITIAHCVQLMLIYPDIRILIASHKKEDGSEPFLKAIKHHFMNNNRFRELFPEYCPKRSKAGKMEWGTKDKIELPNRSQQRATPESTIECAGMNTNVTGRHYDIIKADDLVTKDSVSNESMIQKTRQQNALLDFLFDQPEWGVKDVIGTPYHFADIYAELSRSTQLTKVRIPAVHANGKPTFPERFSKQGIQDIKKSSGMTSYEFSCQYMLNPVPVEDQTFRLEWFEQLGFYYDEEPKYLRKYMLVDPARARNKDSDYTAICVIGIDSTGIMYLLDILRDKLSVEDRTNLVIKTAKKHNIKIVYYESIGFQDTDAYIIRQKVREGDYKISVKPIKASRTSKEDRIRGLQPLYEQGKVKWKKEYRNYSDYHKQWFNYAELLKDEMLMFPKAEHDDMLDAHSFILQVSTAKAEIPSELMEQNPYDWLLKNAVNTTKKIGNKMFGINGKRPEMRAIPSKKSFK